MRRGCKASWTVVENKSTSEYIAFPKTEKDHFHMDGKGYADIAVTAEQADADTLAACKNHGWDEDYIAFLEHQGDVLKDFISHGCSFNDERIQKLIEKARSSSENFKCFGECGSLSHTSKCDFCYRKQHGIWNLCATISIYANFKKLEDSKIAKES